MRLIVFFDLPTKSKLERKKYSSFRKSLINDGFYMLQYSVYARLCNNIENCEKHMKIVESNAPSKGSIRCMVVTEKQYANIRIIISNKKEEEKPIEYYQLSFL